MKYYCDNKRHLVCVPYSVENLHIMAKDLGIKKCWYRAKGRNYHPHYDIPQKLFDEVKSKCILVTDRQISMITKNVAFD